MRPVLVLFLAVLTVSLAPSLAQTPASPAALIPDVLPAGAGRDLVARACVGCHPVTMVAAARKTKDQWAANVDLMIDRGARVSDEEFELIVAYLSEHFAPPR
jgi:aldose sugar dehydrogenase